MFLWVTDKLRKDKSHSDDYMDVILVKFEEARQSLYALLLFIEFQTNWLIIRQFGDDSEKVKDNIIGSWKHLNESSPCLETVAF